MTTIDFTVVDAFTDVPFGGNPAGVVVLKKGHSVSDDFMKLFAREMAHAETAYTYEISPGRYSLRWFTPAIEVDLCGHATLATSHHLFDQNKGLESITFESRSGDLYAKKIDNEIQLEFPKVDTPIAEPPSNLYAVCGLKSDDIQYFGNGMDYLIVIKGGPDAIKALKPNLTALKEFDTRGVIITSKGGERDGIDFTSRFFAPAAGVPEDPVTGSAHCELAPYWSAQLGKNTVVGHQASARGGIVTCTVEGDTVKLQGPAVTVTKGSLVADVKF